MANFFGIPNISDQLVDRSTGLISEDWYRFFETWEAQTHTTVSKVTVNDGTIAGLQVNVTHLTGQITAVNEHVADLGNSQFIANAGLTGGGFLYDAPLTFGLAPIANNTLLANFSGALAAPVPTSLTLALDSLGATQGTVLYRGAAGWASLAPGVGGRRLTTHGAGADPTWDAARELITANRDYYVRKDGNDTNTGLANTAGGAFLTIQKAVDTVASVDIGVFNVTIHVGAGTYAEAVALRSIVGSGVVTLSGDVATPANVIVSAAAGDAFSGINVLATWNLEGFKVTAPAGWGVRGQGFAVSILFKAIDFGVCGNAHILALLAAISASGNYSISGNAPIHAQVLRHAQFSAFSFTITLVGTPAFSTAFASVGDLGLAIFNICVFVGAATGSRYSVASNSVIETGGAAVTFLPGNAAGTTASGGQYL